MLNSAAIPPRDSTLEHGLEHGQNRKIGGKKTFHSLRELMIGVLLQISNDEAVFIHDLEVKQKPEQMWLSNNVRSRPALRGFNKVIDALGR